MCVRLLRGMRTAERPLQRHGRHLLSDKPVCSQNEGSAKLVRIPSKITHPASGLFDQQNAGSRVPFRQAEFPEAVKAPGSDAGQVQCSRAVAAHAVRALGEVAVILKIGTELSVAHWKTGTEQASRKRRII